MWSPSSKELFYRHDGKLFIVTVTETGAALSVGGPTKVFDDTYRFDTGDATGGVANYDVTPDGKRFVMVEEPRAANDSAALRRLLVTLNWLDELSRRVPTK